MKLVFVICVVVAGAAMVHGIPRCSLKNAECVDVFVDKPDSTCQHGGDIFTHGRMDLGIMLDCSDLMTIESFNKAKEYIKAVLNCFTYGPALTRVAVISYCENGGAQMEMSFTESETLEMGLMEDKVDAIAFRGGKLNTMAGLNMLKQAFIDDKRPAEFQVGVYKAAMILTDGKGQQGEETEVVPPAAQEVDLVFALDVTGSMGSAIANIKSEIHDLIVELTAKFEHMQLRIGLCAYRDAGDQKHFQTQPLTSNEAEVQNFIDGLGATGGGDYPEDLLGALDIIKQMDWQAKQTRLVVAITDAPAHGDFTNMADPEYQRANALFYQFKCVLELSHLVLLRTDENPDLTSMHNAFHEIAAQKCTPEGFAPGTEVGWYESALVNSTAIVTQVTSKITKVVVKVSFIKIAEELHAAGIDMFGAGLSSNADYAKLEEILRLAVRRETGSSDPILRIQPGETFDLETARKAFKTLIIAEIDMCAALPCAYGSECHKDGPGAFACCCKPGFEGPTCEIMRCPKCRAEAVIHQIGDPDFFVPTCDADGFFVPKQCHLDECYCVDFDGNEVKGTRVKFTEALDCSAYKTAPEKLSECQLDVKAYEAGTFPFLPVCDVNGLFHHTQCTETHCWCCQGNGKYIPDTFFVKGVLGGPDCVRHNAVKPDCSAGETLYDGFRPHPFDCNRYIRCSPGRIFTCTCQAGLYFDLLAGRCEHHSLVQCPKQPQQDPPILPEQEPPFQPEQDSPSQQ